MSERMQEILDGLQLHLSGDLAGARLAHRHPVARGDASEGPWLTLLQEHLPLRYSAAKGTAIDHTGECSEQIDILIFDRQYTPLIFIREGQLYLPAEGIYAAVEVKQDLSAKHLRYAGEKIESVRRLQRTSAAIPYAGGTYPARPLERIAGAVLTHHSSWSPPFGKALANALGTLNTNQQVDLGCALEDGAFEAQYPKEGEVTLQSYGAERSLVSFLWRLLKRLQSVATVPAIEYDRYLEGI